MNWTEVDLVTTGTSCLGDNVLLYRPEFMDPAQATGLWWLLDPEDVQAVAVNAVCRSALASWDDVGACAGWAQQWPYVFLAAPPSPGRAEAAEELSARWQMPVLLPAAEAFKGCQNVREYIDKRGYRNIGELLFMAQEVPVQGLINLADVDTETRKNARRVLSGIQGLDSMIGGFSGGELSVWTGKRGEGKSTLLSQVLLDAVNQSHRVCVYSGEMPAAQFKLSMLQQAAGYRYVTTGTATGTDRKIFTVDSQARREIDKWWDGCLFLTDIRKDNAHDEDNILGLFEYARRRYGCDTFLVDNIMTARLKQEAQLGVWQAQSEFAGRLVAFATGRDVHVHLVAHPRKTGKASVEADDVGGSGDITNRADNVLKVERVPEDRLGQVGCSTVLTVLKNREFGALGPVKLDFNECDRRFYPAGGGDRKVYTWEMKLDGAKRSKAAGAG